MSNKKDIVNLWISKAETDLRVARILLRDGNPPTDAVCFHVQQAAEKLLKAYLTNVGVRVPKTHDILSILKLCSDVESEFRELDWDALGKLTFYAVEVRYPDGLYYPSLEEAVEALEQVLKLREFVLRKLGD